MSLVPGTRLGPYEIVQPVGRGGMGEVYKARDTRLNRDVAVKVLPQAFVNDAERRERFQRETQAIAALSHPNILAIYDVNLEGEAAYAVTELLEGETLRERLTIGALPVRKTIEYAIQIAGGLAAAHDRGLVHRDLKPDNIFLCRDGHVKILDFGLARASDTGSGAETATALTDPGTVLGTVGYMAPEQVRGQATDGRSDLFAFGAVLYEMLSGRRAFSGDTAADTITAILKDDPADLTGSRPDLSPALDRIVRHCLEKNPSDRFQSARDVAFALEALSGTGTSSPAVLGAAPGARRRWSRVMFGAVALAAALAAGAALHALWRPAGADVSFEIKTFDRQTVMNARFMPDGKTIVFSAARRGTVPELFILHPDSVAPQRIAGPGTHLLAVSPAGELAVLTDSTFIGHRLFRGTLARLTPGGSPRSWLEHVREADWSPDGTTLAIIREIQPGTDRLEYPVGTNLREVRGYLSDVRVSHDGSRIAFVEHRYRFDDRGAVGIIDAKGQRVAMTDELWGVEGLAWTSDDKRVVYSSADLRTSGGIGYRPHVLDASGRRAPTVALATMSDTFVHDVNRDGQWLLASEAMTTAIMVKKPDETTERDLSWLDRPFAGALSRDGKLVVFTDENVNSGSSYGVMIRGTDGSAPVKLGEGAAEDHGLSPDGKWVAAERLNTNQYVFYPTGAGEPRQLDVRPDQFTFSGWFPDSEHVLLCGSASAAPRRCFRQSTSGGAMTPLGPARAVGGAVAPDGSYVVAESEEILWRFPAGGGAPMRLAEVERDADFVGWSNDSQPFLARNSPGGGKEIFYAPTGKPRQKLTEITIADQAALNRFYVADVVGDARQFGYVYGYGRELSTLIVGSGIVVR